MKKTLLYSMAIMLVCGLSAGCGKKNDDMSSSQIVSDEMMKAVTAGLAKEVEKLDYEACTLTFSWWGEESRNEATLNAIERFEEQYPGIDIEPIYGEREDWEATMKEQLSSGKAPDISQVSWNWLYTYSKEAKPFYDLYLATDILDLSQIKQKYLDECMVGDELLGVPVSMTGRLFFFNQTSFDQAGIEIPKDMEDLLKAGEIFKVRLGENYYPLAMNEYDRMIFMIYYLQSLYGKEWVVNNELQYDVKEITQGMEFLRSLEEAHVIPTIQELEAEGKEDLSQNNGWITGRYAGVFAWDTSVIKFRNSLETGQELMLQEFTNQTGPYQGGFAKVSMALAIGNQCVNKREATIFMEYLLNDEEGARILASSRGTPLSAQALSICKEENLLDAQTTEANEKVLDTVSFSMDPKFEVASNETDLYSVYQEIISSLSYGDYNPEEAARMLIQEIETAYAEE